MPLMKDENEISRLREKYPILTHTNGHLYPVLKPHDNVDKYHQYQGKILCATSGQQDREFYALRCNQNKEQGGMVNWSIPFQDGLGENRIFIFEKIKDEFYEYRVPSDFFVPIVSETNCFSGEWVSKIDVVPLAVRHGTKDEIIQKTSAGIYLIGDKEKFLKKKKDDDFMAKLKNPNMVLSAIRELLKEGVLVQVKPPFIRPSLERLRRSNG